MDVPTLVADALGDEAVAAHVPLKGEDTLYVTRTRTLHYRSEGLLSDESVDEYPHDAERIEVEEGRRKATISIDYGTRGQASFGVPSNRLEDALHPVLAGVLNAAGVTDPGETVKRTYRFSELTLVVTSDRLVKHIGSAVWDPEYEEVPYDTVTDLAIEEGNVSSQLVLHTATRTERIKAPNEAFREVAESIQDALFAYYDVADLEEFKNLMAEEEESEVEAETADIAFDEGVDPIDTANTKGAPSQEGGAQAAANQLEEGGFTSAAEKMVSVDGQRILEELETLEASIEEQEAELERQRKSIESIRDLVAEE